MKNRNSKEIAIVFGMFETGLGVSRSLGRKGIKVYGVDFQNDIAFYSKYVTPLTCPHPIDDKESFVLWLNEKFADFNKKIPIFITSDTFLVSISQIRERLKRNFVFNLVSDKAIGDISDKYTQSKLALGAGINTPKTWLIENNHNLKDLEENNIWPLLIKGRDVNSWRQVFGGSKKGIVVNNFDELSENCRWALNNDVSVIIQEIISGPDENHYKYCAYLNKNGLILVELCLQKIRQYPVRFGVGASMCTTQNHEVIDAGRRFLTNIKFTGVGSVEFKYDAKSKNFKLIELNPRYWQQNAICEHSGIEFSYINYCDLMNLRITTSKPIFTKVIWVNRYLDFSSFMQYRKEGLLSYHGWRESLKGEKIYSDFAWDDPIPLLFEFGFGLKLLRFPLYIWKKLTE
jgi:predicted ATP-grasp superfamily ATP-dependent carboligase